MPRSRLAAVHRHAAILASFSVLLAIESAGAQTSPAPPDAQAIIPLSRIARVVLDDALAREEEIKRRGWQRVTAFPVSFPLPFCVFDNGLCGAVNRDGSIAVPPRYDFVDDFHEGRAVVRSRGLYGFVDTQGRVVVEPQYAIAGRYRLGLAEVDVDGKSALIDLEGKPVLEPRFAGAVPFTKDVFWVNEGLRDLGTLRPGREQFVNVPFKLTGSSFRHRAKWGLIDASGNWIRKPEFSDIAGFDRDNDQLAWARADTGWGLIRPDGTWALEPLFHYKGELSDGLAQVWREKKVGFIDRSGRMVIAPKFEPLGTSEFAAGMPAPAKLGARVGLIDRSGGWVVEPSYDTIHARHGGKPAASSELEFNGFLARRGQASDILDRTGKVLIDGMKLWPGTSHSRASPGGGITIISTMGQYPKFCADGRIIGFMDHKPRLFDRDGTPLGELWWPLTCDPPYVVRIGKSMSYFDSALRSVTAERFEAAGLFRHGLAAVKRDGKYGLIRRDGTWAIEPKFDSAQPFQKDTALVKLDGRAGLIDATTGAWVTPTPLDDVCMSEYGIAGATLNGKAGAIDDTGAWVIQPKYDAIGFGAGYISGFRDGLVPVQSAGKWGFVDAAGNEAIEPRYDAVGRFDRGISWTRNGAEWCPIDRRGDKIPGLPCQRTQPVNIHIPKEYSCRIPSFTMLEAPQ
jgi:hypothetical protein